MRKQLFLTAILLIALDVLYAQSNNIYVQAVDSITAPLNKSYITTGILYDRAAPLAALDLFNPQTDTSDYTLFSQAYFELYNASYNTTSLQTPGLLDSIIAGTNVSGFVPIGVLD